MGRSPDSFSHKTGYREILQKYKNEVEVLREIREEYDFSLYPIA